MGSEEPFVDHGAGPGASGAVDASSEPQRYVVADGDDLDAVAARFEVPPFALIGADDRPVQLPMFDDRRDLVPGEPLWIVLALRSLRWLEDGAPDQEEEEESSGDAFVPPPAHPAFVRHFPDGFYSDEADEFAPFGTDEGADARWSILTRSSELPPAMTLSELLAWELGDEVDEALDASEESIAQELDPVLIGVAFTLMRQTGRIDPAGRADLLAAIDRQIGRYGPDPRLIGMRRDVASLP